MSTINQELKTCSLCGWLIGKHPGASIPCGPGSINLAAPGTWRGAVAVTLRSKHNGGPGARRRADRSDCSQPELLQAGGHPDRAVITRRFDTVSRAAVAPPPVRGSRQRSGGARRVRRIAPRRSSRAAMPDQRRG
jgi:hypothetical protein